jgi:hypothetical protein
MMGNSKSGRRSVIVLGDHYTGERVETMLAERAAECGVAIAEAHTFERNQPGHLDDLGESESVVAALSAAIRGGHDVWVPFAEDLGREEHIRRISLVLERHGLALRIGRNLWSSSGSGGINEIDAALRREVRAVDDLDHIAIAAAAMHTLGKEIEMELWRNDLATRRDAKAARAEERTDETLATLLEELAADHGPCPPLPSAATGWSRRQPALKAFAGWLVNSCGLTQTEAAELLNQSGHRTQHGRDWQQWTVSALVRGRYDRRSAA